MTRKNVLVIGGPTASGKSGLALAVAEARGGTVINADSLQVYDALPILTAQPSAEDKARAPHKLYGVLPPDANCSAAKWRQMALDEIRAAEVPIIVGGTGFYISTLLSGLSPIPEIPASFRDAAIALQKEVGTPELHARLKARDPETAAKLDHFNTQRNVRAWEVLEATGKGLSAWQSAPKEAPPVDLNFIVTTLLPPRDTLYRNCDARFDQMIEQGALDEVRNFDGDSIALGFTELRAYLRKQISLDDAVTKAQQATRNYAKRQMTWFRNQVQADAALDVPDAAVLLKMI